VALKAAKMLESSGKQGSVIMIGGSPQYIHKVANYLIHFKTDENVAAYVISTSARMVLPDQYKEIIEEFNSIKSLDQRVKRFGEYCEKTGHYSFNHGTKMLISILNRFKICRDVDKADLPVLQKTSISLIKPASIAVPGLDNDYGWGRFSLCEVKVAVLSGNHTTMLTNPELAELLNLV
jgi:hypothetical protein